jgi:uncharacterized protein YndB with AHSA1/START domain
MKIIKKEIVIEAPVAKVWEHITDSKKIAGWFHPNTFEARVGAAFTIECCEAEDATVSGIVKEIVPQKKLVYSFYSKMTKVETLVTITLTQEGKSTRLTLVHSGWDQLPPDQQNISDQFDGGWGTFLKNLQGTAHA